jgi:hypothetical protein
MPIYLHHYVTFPKMSCRALAWHSRHADALRSQVRGTEHETRAGCGTKPVMREALRQSQLEMASYSNPRSWPHLETRPCSSPVGIFCVEWLYAPRSTIKFEIILQFNFLTWPLSGAWGEVRGVRRRVWRCLPASHTAMSSLVEVYRRFRDAYFRNLLMEIH